MIRATDLSKSFGSVRAVDGVSLDIPEGSVIGLLGPNGAGKSTTVKMLVGYTRPDAGSISIAGTDPLTRPDLAARRIGYLPESAPLYTEMTARAFLLHRAELLGVARRDRTSRVEDAARSCDITDALPKRIAHLSKGFKQRIALASTLLHDPRVLILDEPTNGLDPAQVRQTRSLIRTLAQGRTVLVSSHILPEIERVCDGVVIVSGGRVRASGTLNDLLSESARVEIQWDGGDRDQITEALRSIPGVVVPGGPLSRDAMTLEPADGRDADALAHEANRRVLDLGGRTVRLTRERRSLEDLFMGSLAEGGA